MTRFLLIEEGGTVRAIFKLIIVTRKHVRSRGSIFDRRQILTTQCFWVTMCYSTRWRVSTSGIIVIDACWYRWFRIPHPLGELCVSSVIAALSEKRFALHSCIDTNERLDENEKRIERNFRSILLSRLFFFGWKNCTPNLPAILASIDHPFLSSRRLPPGQ